MLYYVQYPSPVGTLLITCEEESLTGLRIDCKPQESAIPGDGHPVLRSTLQWLDAYFRGEKAPVPVPLNPSGTPFQKQVWKRLLEIPWGGVCTYGQIARELEQETGRRMSAQAVGGAVGSNPISILVPCHRVVGAGGKLTGYAWGLDKKAWLLRHENWEGMKKYDHQ